MDLVRAPGHSVGKKEEDGPCQSPVRAVGNSVGKGEEDRPCQGDHIL